MKIELKNVGMLKEAIVKLDGLTVIAGENDTGKSTVGKIIFCIIKAISRYEEDFQESRDFKIKEKLDRLFFYLRKNTNIFSVENEKTQEILDILVLEHFTSSENIVQDHIYKLRNDIKEVLANIKYEENFIEQILDELELIINTPEDKQKSIENALTKVFRSEFNSNILYNNESIGYIKLYENDFLLLNIEITKDNKVILKNEVEIPSIVIYKIKKHRLLQTMLFYFINISF